MCKWANEWTSVDDAVPDWGSDLFGAWYDPEYGWSTGIVQYWRAGYWIEAKDWEDATRLPVKFWKDINWDRVWANLSELVEAEEASE